MRTALRNREPRMALGVGALVAIITGLFFALDIILDEGGGSVSRGWNPGLGFLSFYGILMLPILAIVGLVAMGLSRLLGGGIVMLAAIVLFGVLLIHSAVSSTPGAQLARVTGRSGIPDLQFEQFKLGHTFSDGTSYMWVARCSPAEATELTNALRLKPISTMVKEDGPIPMLVEHQVVSEYRSKFGGGIAGIEFYMDDLGMIGGYSARERIFRLYWWPAVREEGNGQ